MTSFTERFVSVVAGVAAIASIGIGAAAAADVPLQGPPVGAPDYYGAPPAAAYPPPAYAYQAPPPAYYYAPPAVAVVPGPYYYPGRYYGGPWGYGGPYWHYGYRGRFRR